MPRHLSVYKDTSENVNKTVYESAKPLPRRRFISLEGGPRGRRPLAWESHVAVGDLEEYRENEGLHRKVFVLGKESIEEIEQVVRSIRARFNRVFPSETWSVKRIDREIWLGYLGRKDGRRRKATTTKRKAG